MSDLSLSLIQAPLAWEDPVANRAYFDKQLQQLSQETDVILLPEMFCSGFSMQPENFSEEPLTVTENWMQQWSVALDAAIYGSVATKQGNDHINRGLWVTPDSIQTYDKVHLFRMGKEPTAYKAGNERVVVEYQGWRILLVICYDIRFPAFCRNQDDYDLMLCVANWPAARSLHWSRLLAARAIENQTYVAAVNRIGMGGGIEYQGDSNVWDWHGEPLVHIPTGQAMTASTKLDLQALQKYREAFPAWKDRDTFTLTL